LGRDAHKSFRKNSDSLQGLQMSGYAIANPTYMAQRRLAFKLLSEFSNLIKNIDYTQS
jgi:hypothetical protein